MGKIGMDLVLQTTIFYWMFGETTISYVKNWNHPIETTTNKWMFGVPGISALRDGLEGWIEIQCLVVVFFSAEGISCVFVSSG